MATIFIGVLGKHIQSEEVGPRERKISEVEPARGHQRKEDAIVYTRRGIIPDPLASRYQGLAGHETHIIATRSLSSIMQEANFTPTPFNQAGNA